MGLGSGIVGNTYSEIKHRYIVILCTSTRTYYAMLIKSEIGFMYEDNKDLIPMQNNWMDIFGNKPDLLGQDSWFGLPLQ